MLFLFPLFFDSISVSWVCDSVSHCFICIGKRDLKTMTIKILFANSSLFFLAFLWQFFPFHWYLLLISRKRWDIFIANKIFVIPSMSEWNLWHQGQKMVTLCYPFWTVELKSSQTTSEKAICFSVWPVLLDLLWLWKGPGKKQNKTTLLNLQLQTGELCWSVFMLSILSC